MLHRLRTRNASSRPPRRRPNHHQGSFTGGGALPFCPGGVPLVDRRPDPAGRNFTARDRRFFIPPNAEPNNLLLNQLARCWREDVPAPTPSLDRLLFRHLDMHDYAAVANCGKTQAFRQEHKVTGHHRFVPRLCRSPWCFLCVFLQGRRDHAYQLAKFASVDPRESAFRVGHLVFTLPPPLWPLIQREPTALSAWRDACMGALSAVYGCHKRELGAVFNLHPFGEDNPEWPKWSPHLDVVLNGYRLKKGKDVVRLMDRFPYPFNGFRQIYEDRLRRAFYKLPILGAERDCLRAKDFVANVHVVQSKQRPFMVEGYRAAHLIGYSCRSHFMPHLAGLIESKDGHPLGDRMVYRPKAARVVHRPPARAAMDKLIEVKRFLSGRECHVWTGYLSKNTYGKSVAHFGHEQVYARQASDWAQVARYSKNREGNWGKE